MLHSDLCEECWDKLYAPMEKEQRNTFLAIMFAIIGLIVGFWLILG